MKVRLNLATNALQTHRRFFAASGVVGAIAGIGFILLGWHVYSVRKADEALRAKTEQVQEEMSVLIEQRKELAEFFARPENARLRERSEFLNALIDEKSLNWTRMFMDLEKVLPSGVRVVSIQPQRDKQGVKIQFVVVAANDEAKLKFMRALEASPSFASVVESNEREDEHSRTLLVVLSVEYLRA